METNSVFVGGEENAHLIALSSAGFSLGLVHVLAGPDHLSALAALSVGTSWKAFVLGFRWGLGHSTGLIVVAIIFIALKGELDLRSLGRYCDFIVGMFMIGLGCYGVIGALKMYRQKKTKRDDWESEDSITQSTSDSILALSITNTKENKLSRISSKSEIDDKKEINLENGNFHISPRHNIPRNGDVTIKTMQPIIDHHNNHDNHYNNNHHDDINLTNACPILPSIDMHDPTTQKLISFSIGLLHGVAGPGGILGVLPAVEMQNWRYSFVYLISFILSSTLSMGTFAALYGEITKRLSTTMEIIELSLNIFSSGMSIIVGTIWLVLSLLGKLEGLFH